MALSPADFYAYSRATGAQIPEDPEERAQMAPEVLEFRRNQLKGQPEGPNLLATLGAAAAATAGAIGLGLAGRRLLRGPQKSATAPVQVTDIASVRRAAAPIEAPAPSKPAPVAQPEVDITDVLVERYRPAYEQEKKLETGRMTQAEMRRQAGVVANIEQKIDDLLTEIRSAPVAKPVEETPRFSPRQYAEQTGSLEPTDLTSVQEATEPLQRDQFINAVESGEDQQTGRIKQQLQRNEDYDLSQIEVLEEIAEYNRVAGMEQDEPINVVAAQMPDGLPVDQAEGTRALSSQDLADMAKEEMMALRQDLAARGLRPGTQRFERALAQTWTTKAIPGAEPGTPKFRELQEQGKVDVSLPGMVRKAVEAESAGAGPMGFIPERTVINIGPEAKITSTAAGTAIRGASPSAYEALPVNRTRQIFGTADPLVLGAPDEDMPDLPGALRLRGGPQPDVEPQQLSKQEIVYGVLDRPAQEERPGGSAGIGVYGIEPGYLPGAVSKSTGEYSAASTRQPTYVPGWLQKKQMPIKTGFEQLSTPTIEKLIAGEGKTPLSKPRMQMAQDIVAERGRAKESLAASEVLRRARIEGRDPQMILKQFGIGI